jgi:hypothetical protein
MSKDSFWKDQSVLRFPKPTVSKNPQRPGTFICRYTKVAEDGEKLMRAGKTFHSRKEAEAFAMKIENEQRRPTRNFYLEAANLPDERVLTLLRINELIKEFNLSEQDVRQTIERYSPMASSRELKIPNAVEAYLKVSKTKNKPTTFNGDRTRLRRFARECEIETMNDVIPEKIVGFIDSVSAGQRRHFFYALCSFFGYFSDPRDKTTQVLRANPMELVRIHYERHAPETLEDPNTDRDPTCLSIRDLRTALRHGIGLTLNGKHRLDFLGTVVFGSFLGMRPCEIERLSLSDRPWESHIKLSQGIVVVDRKIAGKRSEIRNIPIRPNVKEWLVFIRDYGYQICYNTRSQKARMSYAAFRRSYLGLRSRDPQWKDTNRHTFGTMLYHTRASEDRSENVTMDQIVRQMGNSIRVYITHYRGILVEGDTPDAFWSIVPSDFGIFTEEGFQLNQTGPCESSES